LAIKIKTVHFTTYFYFTVGKYSFNPYLTKMELSKSEKRRARALLSQGVEKKFAIGLGKFDAIIQQWKEGKHDNREGYYAVFKEVKDFDKHIARRYDDVSNSLLFDKVIELMNDKLISEEDLEGFSEEIIEKIKFYVKNG
jgi:hypothetical protein